MKNLLTETIEQIRPLDETAISAARARQDQLTKPQGALGRLESLSIQIAGATQQARPKIKNPVVITIAGDHGITQQGVSAYPSEVTPQMVLNFLHGGAAINVLARHVGARVVVVDMGVNQGIPFPAHPNFVNAKLIRGTNDLSKGAAMTRAEAQRAVQTGIEIVTREISRGADIIGTGDMGIGNTTPSYCQCPYRQCR